jgi:hypothetical protein
MNCGLANGERAKIQAVSLLPWIGPTALLANLVDTAVDAAERPDLLVRTGGAGSVGQVPIFMALQDFIAPLPHLVPESCRAASAEASIETNKTNKTS